MERKERLAVCAGVGVLVAIGGVLGGCYRKTISSQGIGSVSQSQRYEQPNAPDPGTPWYGPLIGESGRDDTSGR